MIEEEQAKHIQADGGQGCLDINKWASIKKFRGWRVPKSTTVKEYAATMGGSKCTKCGHTNCFGKQQQTHLKMLATKQITFGGEF
jgi:hypothetical protein